VKSEKQTWISDNAYKRKKEEKEKREKNFFQERMFTMKTKKKLAFITAMALLMGTQTASLYTNAATVDEPAAAAETVTDTAAHGVTVLPLYAKAESVKEKIKAEAQELAEANGISAEEAEKQTEEKYRQAIGNRVIYNDADLFEYGFGFIGNKLIHEECVFIAGMLGCDATEVFDVFRTIAEPLVFGEDTYMNFEIKAGELYKALEESGYDCSELWMTEVPAGKTPEELLAEMTEDDADIVLSFTDATVRPGGTTYIDAIIDTKLDMSALLMAYKFDEDVFSLESVSLNEEFRSSDEMYDALMLSDDRRALIFVSETGLNVPVNGKYLVRFAFKVDENAPEGTYDITPYQKSALMAPACRYNEKTDRQENMKVFFKPGKIKVSASEKPETNIKPEPLTRKYIMEDSVMVGDTNSDQIINSMDIVGEKTYILGMAEDVKGGDTNEDGSVNVIDYIVLENALLK